jgi:hypothetical protein
VGLQDKHLSVWNSLLDTPPRVGKLKSLYYISYEFYKTYLLGHMNFKYSMGLLQPGIYYASNNKVWSPPPTHIYIYIFKSAYLIFHTTHRSKIKFNTR